MKEEKLNPEDIFKKAEESIKKAEKNINDKPIKEWIRKRTVRYFGVYCLKKEDNENELKDEKVNVYIPRPNQKNEPENIAKAKQELETKLKEIHGKTPFTILEMFTEYKDAEQYMLYLQHKCREKQEEDDTPAEVTLR